jgi:Protein of unknown function (DUF3551)
MTTRYFGAPTKRNEDPRLLRGRALFVDDVTLAVMTVPASAQSPTSYPWCARSAKMDSGGTSCYFTSYRQCMTTLSGLGGYCFQSPYYHGPAAKVRAQAAR